MPNQENPVLPEPQARRLPARFQPVVVRCVTPVDAAWGEMGVEFVLPDGSTVAYRLDVAQLENISKTLNQHEAAVARRIAGPLDVDYSEDDYPRDGCTMVVSLRNGKYDWTVYPPGVPIKALGYPLEGRAPRKYASIGIAIHAFMHRHSSEKQAVLREMVLAERAYEASSGSCVTV